MEFDNQQKALIERARARSGQFDLLSIASLAAKLGISVRTVRRLHALGEGPARVKHGRKLMYRQSEIDAWLESSGQGEK